MSTDTSRRHAAETGAAPGSAEQFDRLTEVISRSQHSYRELIDNLDQALFTLSLAGEVRVANLRLAELLGVSFSELIGHSLGEFVDSPTLAEANRAIPSLLKKGTWSGTLPIKLKRDKQPRYFSCWLQTIAENGQVVSVTGWARDVTEEREAEGRVAELFESLRAGMLFTTPDGKVLGANYSLVHMLGYDSLEELQTHNFGEMYVNLDERKALMRELEQKGAVHDREFNLRRKDGRTIRCVTSVFAIRDVTGRTVRVQGTLVDITERAEIERRLRQEQEFRQRLVSNFPDMIAVLDRDMRFTFVSDHVRDLLGRSPEEYVGTEIGSRATPQNRAKLREMAASILTGRKSRAQLEFTAPRPDGALRTLVVTAGPLFGETGEITGVVTSSRDVTETRQMEKQLRKEQEFTRRLIECFPDMIGVVDREGRYTFVSDRVSDLFGVTPEQLLGQKVGARTHPEDVPLVSEMTQEIMAGRKRGGEVESRGLHADGSWRTIRVSASPLFDEKGDITGVVASVRDVTEAKAIAQQLAQKEKLAAMGQMMVGAAHELNNPLTAILGLSDLLRERATDDATRRQVDLVLHQARRAATIVQNLLTFSRPVTLGRSSLDLPALLQEVLQIGQASLDQKKIRVTFESSADVPAVAGDKRLLKEVFLNIIANAEQSISAARGHGTLAVKVTQADGTVRASFTDDGGGIPTEILGKIFDPFFTTKRASGSSGLGLTLCLAVVKEHGGRIEAESQPGAGATVHVLLPAAAPAEFAPPQPVALPAAQPIPTGSEKLRGRSVVVVDDEESIREIVQDGLTARGINVAAFGSPKAALDHVAKHSCDVVLCDFNLPGMNGEEFFDRLRRERRGALPCFVFMTGEVFDPSIAGRYRRMGVTLFEKPFHVSALTALLEGLLSPQPARTA